MARALATAAKIHRLMEAIARAARSPGGVYLTGGGSAVLEAWREMTVDVDLKLDPEPAGVFEALRTLKDDLELNIELACPADFIPELPGWREHSPLIVAHGRVAFYHYDFRAQALAKIERGHVRDLDDVNAMLGRKLTTTIELQQAYEAIEPALVRYPALDADAFRAKLDDFLESWTDERSRDA